MELLLTVASYGGLPPERPLSLSQGAGACTLGRNPGNDLALSDPERLVSGLHARIDVRPDGVWLTDKSTNGTFLNHAAERLPPGEPVQIHDGDILSLGPYELVVTLAGAASEPAIGADPFATFGGPDLDLLGMGGSDAPGHAGSAGTAGADLDLPGMVGPGPAPDIMALLGGSGGEPAPRPESPLDRFADARPLDSVLDGPAPEAEAALAEHRPTPAEHVYFRPPDTQSIPDNYDLLGDLSAPIQPGASPVPEPVPGSAGADSFRMPDFGDDPFAQSVAPGSAPPGPAADRRPATVSGAEPGLQSEPKAAEPLPTPQAAALPEPEWSFAEPSLDLDLEPEAAPRPQRDPEPVGPATDSEDRAQAAPAIAIPQPAGRSAVPAAAGQRETVRAAMPVNADTGAAGSSGLAALLAGLGAGDPAQIQDPEALLHGAGALLRALVAGLAATMMVRARFKSELRVGMTTLRPTENNPFKFSVGVDEALERLLLRRNPGFLPPVEAAREAFDDIQAHEMAVLAGLRAALRALLARFEPAALEARLDPASGLDKLLPMARKSRIWEQFTAEYGRVAADAEEDFMQLFGEAFTRAYEDQIYRLSQARGPRPPG